MQNNTKTTIYEWCPYCEAEVEIAPRFEAQICPNCGKRILPCSLVDGCANRCAECPLEDK